MGPNNKMVTTDTEESGDCMPFADTFLDSVASMLIQYMKGAMCAERPVVKFLPPEQLAKELDLTIRDEGQDMTKLLQHCRRILDRSVATCHPRFNNQLFAACDPVAVAGEWLTAAANASMYTYEVAPVFTLMEAEVIKTMGSYVGFEDGDGIFAPGGSMSNLYAMLAARHYTCPHIRTKGVQATDRLVVVASRHVHYSIQKMAMTMGLGAEGVVYVDCDAWGCMQAESLDRVLMEVKDQGKTPIMVVAVAGTTVFGAFDPINDIADVCERHGVWLHVDAAYGGAVLLSRTHRGLLAGVERADSVTWNPHKMMSVPQQCSCVLLRRKGILHEMNACHAEYLFQPDKEGYSVVYDTGDKSLQCGRRVDVFKLWLAWKAKGTWGYERQVDHSFVMAQYLAGEIRAREGFELVLEPQGTNICFFYIPKALRDSPRDKAFYEALHKVAPQVKARIAGEVMVAYTPFHDLPNFFRMVTVSPLLQARDMDVLLDAMDAAGSSM